MGDLVFLDTFREPWLSKKQMAKELGVTTRYLEYRMAEGLPSRLMGRRRLFRRSVVEGWLRDNGHLDDGSAA